VFENAYKLRLSYYAKRYHSAVIKQVRRKLVPKRIKYKMMDIARAIIGEIEKSEHKRVMRIEVECAKDAKGVLVLVNCPVI
jgi:hypothetical protein